MPPATVNRVRVPGVSFTLLELATLNGQLQVVEALLSFGVDVSIRIVLSSGAFIQGYGSAVVLACGPGLHQKRLEHCKAYSRSEIVAVLLSDYVAFSAAIRTCCIRSLSPISRCCFGAASAASARLLISTRDFSGPHLHRCSLLSLMPIQLPKNLPLKKRGKCTAGSAARVRVQQRTLPRACPLSWRICQAQLMLFLQSGAILQQRVPGCRFALPPNCVR